LHVPLALKDVLGPQAEKLDLVEAGVHLLALFFKTLEVACLSEMAKTIVRVVCRIP